MVILEFEIEHCQLTLGTRAQLQLTIVMVTGGSTKFVVLLEIAPIDYVATVVTLLATELAAVGVFEEVKHPHLGFTTASPVSTLHRQRTNEPTHPAETIIAERGNRLTTASVVRTESIIVVIKVAASFASVRFNMGQYLRVKLGAVDVHF